MEEKLTTDGGGAASQRQINGGEVRALSNDTEEGEISSHEVEDNVVKAKSDQSLAELGKSGGISSTAAQISNSDGRIGDLLGVEAQQQRRGSADLLSLETLVLPTTRSDKVDLNSHDQFPVLARADGSGKNQSSSAALEIGSVGTKIDKQAKLTSGVPQTGEKSIADHDSSVVMVMQNVEDTREGGDRKSYSAAVGGKSALLPQVIPVETINGERVGIIPESMIQDSKPLWSDLLVGRFAAKAPHVAKIHVIVNKIWSLGDKKIKIDVFTMSETMVKFRIRDSKTRERVLRRGMWSIANIPMYLSRWAPVEELKKEEVKTMPLWITLKNVPHSLFSWSGLSGLAGVVGEAKKLHPETELCVKFDEARVLTEVDINKELPEVHKFQMPEGEDVIISFSYPWFPKRCILCGGWGHEKNNCASAPVAEMTTHGMEKVKGNVVENSNGLREKEVVSPKASEERLEENVEDETKDQRASKQLVMPHEGETCEIQAQVTHAGVDATKEAGMNDKNDAEDIEVEQGKLLEIRGSPTRMLVRSVDSEVDNSVHKTRGNAVKDGMKDNGSDEGWMEGGSKKNRKTNMLGSSHLEDNLFDISPSRFDLLANAPEDIDSMDPLVDLLHIPRKEEAVNPQAEGSVPLRSERLKLKQKSRLMQDQMTQAGGRGAGRGTRGRGKSSNHY